MYTYYEWPETPTEENTEELYAELNNRTLQPA